MDSASPSGAFVDLAAAATNVLTYLQERLPMGLWMVTRTERDDWIVLHARGEGYEIGAGDVFRWSDSYCSRMVAGLGPRVAPDVKQIEAYTAAPISDQLTIGAYIGVPMTSADGSLFGTICAIDPQERAVEIARELPLVELLARLLSTILARELAWQAELRRAEHAELDAQLDGLTGIANRLAWDRTVSREEERCARYGAPASILFVDLNGLKTINDTQGHAAGDEVLRAAASALSSCARTTDFVARLGGDEFAILAVETDHVAAASLVRRVEDSLLEARVSGAIGVATRDPRTTLEETARTADADMYRDKQLRKAGVGA